LEVGIAYNRMLCNDFTGPARFRLNMPEVALELKRVWHPWSMISSKAIDHLSIKPRLSLLLVSRGTLIIHTVNRTSGVDRYVDTTIGQFTKVRVPCRDCRLTKIDHM